MDILLRHSFMHFVGCISALETYYMSLIIMLPYILKKTIYILLFLGFGINFCFSQTVSEKRFGLTVFDSTIHKRIYRVQTEDYQILELMEFKKDSFEGSLTHLVWKTNRKEIRKDSIVQKIAISDLTVKKLISELESNGFEKLKDCKKVEDCISGLDGTTTSFITIKSRETNTASYWELESDYYYNQNEVKLPAEVLKARKLTLIINTEFDLKEEFENFLNRLPNGRYLYSMLIMKKK